MLLVFQNILTDHLHVNIRRLMVAAFPAVNRGACTTEDVTTLRQLLSNNVIVTMKQLKRCRAQSIKISNIGGSRILKLFLPQFEGKAHKFLISDASTTGWEIPAKERKKEGKLRANARKRVAAGAHPWLFEPAERPDDRAEYCLDCSFLPQWNHRVLVFTL